VISKMELQKKIKNSMIFVYKNVTMNLILKKELISNMELSHYILMKKIA
jgi:hypothetical protein